VPDQPSLVFLSGHKPDNCTGHLKTGEGSTIQCPMKRHAAGSRHRFEGVLADGTRIWIQWLDPKPEQS
jgi:hypothetical protein